MYFRSKRESNVLWGDQRMDAQQKRNAEGKLHLKRQEMDKAKVRDHYYPYFASSFLKNS